MQVLHCTKIKANVLVFLAVHFNCLFFCLKVVLSIKQTEYHLFSFFLFFDDMYIYFKCDRDRPRLLFHSTHCHTHMRLPPSFLLVLCYVVGSVIEFR